MSAYLKQKENQGDRVKVFINPETGLQLNAASLALWLCKVVVALVPGAVPRAHDLRKYSYSLAWARGIPMAEIIRKGFWSFSNVFINKYLVKTPTGVVCIVGASQ